MRGSCSPDDLALPGMLGLGVSEEELESIEALEAI